MFMRGPIGEKFRIWAEREIRPIPLSLDQEGPPPLELWEKAARTNLFRLLAPTDFGGQGLGLRDMAAALHGLVLGGMDLPVAASFAAHGAIGLDLLLRFGSPSQKTTYLPSMFDGTRIAAVCNSEEFSGTDVRKLRAEFREENANGDGGHGRLDALKGCVTNASVAGICFVSAWRARPNGKRAIEIFLVEGHELAKSPIHQDLAGFRTGWTGKIQVRDLRLDLAARQIGAAVGGFEIFRRCFNLERLFMAVMVSGLLEGLEQEAKTLLREREAGGHGIASHQYVQEKVVALFAARTKLNAVIELVLAAGDENIGQFEKELGVLKLLIVEDAYDAAAGHFELVGHRAYAQTALPQKILRDLLGLRFFGGTRELQKMTIFQSLFADGASHSRKKAA